MKNLFFLCLTIILPSNLIIAQTGGTPGMSKINLHFDAATLIFINSATINLEGKFLSSDSEKFHLYGRAGYGYVDVSTLVFCNGQNASGGLLGLTMLTGKGNHHFEANGGAFLGSFKNNINDSGIFGSCDNAGFEVLPLIDIGYRFQKPEGGVIFRAKMGSLGVGLGLGIAF